MLNTEPDNLLLEVEGAEEHRDKHTSVIDELQLGYRGAYYREDEIPDLPTPENHAFEFVSLTLPKLIYDNPQVAVSSRSPAIPAETALAIEYALNQWIKDEDLQEQLEMAIFDALFGYGVMLTTLDDVEDREVETDQLRKMMPKCRHLERHLYFRDPTATTVRKPRFEGHVWVRDKADVLDMEGIIPEAVESLSSDGELARLRRPNGEDSPERDEIVAYEVWVPECNDYNTENDPCCNGTIFTLAVGQVVDSDAGNAKKGRKAAYIRAPRPFYGPKTGPYTLFGFYPVSGQCYPLGPIAVTAEQAEEVNVHATAVAEAAGRMKNLVFVDSTHDELANAVKMSPDGSIIGIAGLAGKAVTSTSVGGPSSEQLMMLEKLRERLDRVSGMSDAYRGNTNPDITATADNIAMEGVTARLDYLKKRAATCVGRVLWKAGWLMHNTHNVVIPLGQEAAQAFQMNQPVFLGGLNEGEEDQSFDRMAIEIEPMSMERIDERTLRATVLEVMGIIVQLAQEMPNMPWLNWQVLLDQLARIHNFRWLRQVINDQLFRTFMAETMQANSQQQQAELQLKQAELQIKMAQASQDKISQGMNYKEVPEDIKRQMEEKAGYVPSTIPLTAASHVQNQLKLHEGEKQAQHDRGMQSRDHAHQANQDSKKQVHERKQSVLAGLLKASADKNMAGGSRPKRKAG
jgi:hypothetical protein